MIFGGYAVLKVKFFHKFTKVRAISCLYFSLRENLFKAQYLIAKVFYIIFLILR